MPLIATHGWPSGDPAEFADLSDEDAAALEYLEDFTAGGGLADNAGADPPLRAVG